MMRRNTNSTNLQESQRLYKKIFIIFPEKSIINAMAKDTNTDIAIISNDDIKSKIYNIRGMQVMLDSDLAALYGILTKNLNKAVDRNQERFPSDFCFQLTDDEYKDLKFQNGTSNTGRGGRRYLPYVFTEQGVAMLSGILHSETAVAVSISIMKAFVAMRHFIADNAGIFQRLDRVETKLLNHDEKIDKIFKQLEASTPGNAAIFFMGTFYDAKSFVGDLVAKANESLILIDDYISKATLDILRRRKDGVSITIYTTSKPRNKDRLSENEIKDFNNQYGKLEVKSDDTFHDRFLIIDNKELYSIGASLKDAGSKTFAINRMDDELILRAMLERLN